MRKRANLGMGFPIAFVDELLAYRQCYWEPILELRLATAAYSFAIVISY